MKKSVLLFTILTALALIGCGNTTATTPASSSVPSSTTPTSSVAEVKEPYIAIGGINPYEELTATEKKAIEKAEEEARLQAEAKAKADAEAKAKAQAEAKKKAEAQKQANQQAEGVTNTSSTINRTDQNTELSSNNAVTINQSNKVVFHSQAEALQYELAHVAETGAKVGWTPAEIEECRQDIIRRMNELNSN